MRFIANFEARTRAIARRPGMMGLSFNLHAEDKSEAEIHAWQALEQSGARPSLYRLQSMEMGA